MKASLLSVFFASLAIPANGQDHLQRPSESLAKIEAHNPEIQSLIFAKSFCVAMRRNHQPEKSSNLLKFIDPVYLKEHKIDPKKSKLKTFPLFNIYDIKISADPSSILCIVDTQNGPREALLLRTKIIGEKTYLTPVAAPSKEDQSFEPWILRMNAAPAPILVENGITVLKAKRLVGGILEHFPQNVKSVEAWEGSEFKISGSTIFPTKEVTREALLQLVGKHVSVTGNWNPGKIRKDTEEQRMHSSPLFEGSDIVGSGLEATSIRKID